MVTTDYSHGDRREGVRFSEPGGWVLCQIGSSRCEYRIANTSESGLAMRGARLALGTPVSLEIHWPMIGKASAQGVVCRANEGRESVAVRYTENDGISDLMQSLQEVARLRTREAVPMFCGSNGEMREVMAELDSLGLRYKRVDRPISALCVLKNPWKPVTTLVFPPSSHWLVFSGLLGTNHPELRRLLVDGGLSPLGAELAVAHSIVDDTWSRARDASGLHEALGISLSGDDCLSCGLPLAVSSSAFCATCLDRSSSLGPQDDLGGCG